MKLFYLCLCLKFPTSPSSADNSSVLLNYPPHPKKMKEKNIYIFLKYKRIYLYSLYIFFFSHFAPFKFNLTTDSETPAHNKELNPSKSLPAAHSEDVIFPSSQSTYRVGPVFHNQDGNPHCPTDRRHLQPPGIVVAGRLRDPRTTAEPLPVQRPCPQMEQPHSFKTFNLSPLCLSWPRRCVHLHSLLQTDRRLPTFWFEQSQRSLQCLQQGWKPAWTPHFALQPILMKLVWEF